MRVLDFVLVSLSLLIGLGIGAFLGRRAARREALQRRTDARSERVARMIAILNALPDTLLVVDREDRIVELKLAQRSGRTQAVPRLLDVGLDDLFSKPVAESFRAGRDACLELGNVIRMEIELDLVGERRQCEVRIVRADPDHVAALIRDVTEQKVTEHVLMDAKATAEAIVAARTELMGSLGHDIRNAMTGVLTMTDVMLHRAADPASKRYLEIIQRSGEHLVGLVRDIVDFSRLENGHMPFSPEPTDLRDVLEDAMDFHAGATSASELDVCAEVHASVPELLVIDGFRVRQLLDNLVGNAIKFTEQGEVFVQARYEHGALDLTVRDTGVGMSEETLEKVFDVFVQAPNRPRGKQAGSGLGLSIARQLVTSMGGTLTAQSREGEGSTFRMILPCAAASPSPRKRRAYAGRALVATDGEALRGSVVSLLAALGFETRTDVESQEPVDVALVDVRLGQPALATLGLRASRVVRIVGSTDAVGDPLALPKPVRRERLEACLAAAGYTGQKISVDP